MLCHRYTPVGEAAKDAGLDRINFNSSHLHKCAILNGLSLSLRERELGTIKQQHRRIPLRAIMWQMPGDVIYRT